MDDKDLTVQWCEGNAMVFFGEDCVATITEGSRAEVTARLKLLGLRPTRWKETDWGAESNVVQEGR